MTSTQKGAFCQKCSKEVYDVSHLANNQIIGMLASESKVPCMRMTTDQERTLNVDLGRIFQSRKKQMQRAMLFSLLIVFGFTLFSCNSPQQIHERNLMQAAAESVVEISEELPVQTIETKALPQVIEPIQVIRPEVVPEIIEEDFEVFATMGEPAMIQEVIAEQERELFDVKLVTSRTAGVPMMLDHELLRDEFTMFEGDVNFDLTRDPNNTTPETFSALTFPNPATTDTRLEVKLPGSTENLGIRLLSMTGEVLQEINSQAADAGVHEFHINLMDLKPAFYLIDVRYNDSHEVVRLSKVH